MKDLCHYLAVGPGCWGKARTPELAIKNGMRGWLPGEGVPELGKFIVYEIKTGEATVVLGGQHII